MFLIWKLLYLHRFLQTRDVTLLQQCKKRLCIFRTTSKRSLLVEEHSQEDAGDVPAMETAQVSSDDENDDTEEIEEEQGQEDEGCVETAVPVSSDEASRGTEEMEEEDQQGKDSLHQISMLALFDSLPDANSIFATSGADDAAPPRRASRDLASPLATATYNKLLTEVSKYKQTTP
ncbi:uncharacterized protein [Triticum aestivum]|uniref:uncharacterized protein n=1 Tax=Triticum aestivum TaxID=4565 RepID=UPI001D00EB0A|nr:uncharacterized protein LOC123067443 [Triticum aestivum]